ncbi:MAG TPA: hypothetical protein VLZ05_23380 [Mycobacterium sp.]|nr:hypothetical protein [Mycobacterium sp.]HUH71563.1 hypothetical protein [Mycobacterium sp.]
MTGIDIFSGAHVDRQAAMKLPHSLTAIPVDINGSEIAIDADIRVVTHALRTTGVTVVALDQKAHGQSATVRANHASGIQRVAVAGALHVDLSAPTQTAKAVVAS